MQRISSRLTGPMTWVHRGTWKSQFDLRAGDQPVAELSFNGTWRTVATAQSEDGCWTFKDEGFLHRRTMVRRCESDDVIATFFPGAWTSTGRLETKSGATYYFKSRPFRSLTEVRAHPDDTTPLVTFRNEGFWRTRTRVELSASASSHPDVPLLVLFGYYFIVCQRRKAAVAAAT